MKHEPNYIVSRLRLRARNRSQNCALPVVSPPISRRRFFADAASWVAAIAVPAGWALTHAAPIRYIEAIRARFYPGPVAQLDKFEMDKPSWWGG